MTDAVKRALMGLAQEDYMKMVEERKAKERELEAEVKRLKNEGKRAAVEQHNGTSKDHEHTEVHDSE